jgi:hypothetical protein
VILESDAVPSMFGTVPSVLVLLQIESAMNGYGKDDINQA